MRSHIRGNSIQLWLFVGVNFAIFLSIFVSKEISGSSIDDFWKRVTAKDGIIAACIPVLTVVLNGLLGDIAKARLVFWHWRDPLPGCRVFTDLMSADPRIDARALENAHGELPNAPRAQNNLWYEFYKKHNEALQVSQGHRVYLLTRDMTALSAVLALLFVVGLVLKPINWRVALLYGIALIIQYLVLATAARNYGKRFVLNVLAEESHSR